MIIEDLSKWQRITVDEMIAKVGNITSLEKLIASYCQDKPDKVIDLYLPDRGTLAKLVRSSFGDTSKFVIMFKSLIPGSVTPSLDMDYYWRNIAITHNESCSRLTEEENLSDMSLREPIMSLIIEDYCKYNKHVLYNIYTQYDKHILYVIDRGTEFDVIPNWYALSSLAEDRIFISERETGVYYKSYEDDAVIFAQLDYSLVAGDAYFRTKYYKVNEDLTKSFIPTEEVNLWVDTAELAAIFSSKIQFPSITSDEALLTFEGNEESDFKDVLDNVLAGRLYLRGDNSVTLATNSMPTARVDVVLFNYMRYATDFILSFGMNSTYLYSSYKKNLLLRNVDYKTIFNQIVRTKRYHERQGRSAFTPFNSRIYYTNTSDIKDIRRAVDHLKDYKDIVLYHVDEKCVSLGLQFSVNEEYYTMTYYLSGNHIRKVRFSDNLSLYDGDEQAWSAVFLSDLDYIAASFIFYIRDHFRL